MVHFIFARLRELEVDRGVEGQIVLDANLVIEHDIDDRGGENVEAKGVRHSSRVDDGRSASDLGLEASAATRAAVCVRIAP